MLKIQFLLVTTTFFYSASTCPDDWLSHNSSCYFLAPSRLTWTEAMYMCHILGGYLAEANTAAEATYLENITAIQYIPGWRWESFWIGGSDIQNEQHWVWMTSKTNFATGVIRWLMGCSNAPNREQNCMKLQGNLWCDMKCTETLRFVCEMNNLQTPIVG